jgi:transcriptional regulator with GAF, ATPase, and Fis domain
MGKFELASKGSIFLDEIGTVQKAVQIKLLKVLQERIFQRVGGETDIQTDARIIAATNIDLDALAKQGDFRRDLYYRLNVFPIELLPLRERVEDIPLLCDVFLESLNNENLKEITGIHPQVLEAFNKYSWPGNIRELENLMERAYILETSSVLTPESFPSDLFSESAGEEALVIVDANSTLAEARRKGVEGVERRYLKTLLENNSGKIKLSATAAGVSTRQLHKLLARYGIRKEEFKTQLKTPE